MKNVRRIIRMFVLLALCVCLWVGCAGALPGSTGATSGGAFPVPKAADSNNAAGADGSLPPIDDGTWDEIEKFLNDSKLLGWLGPDSLGKIYTGDLPNDSYPAASLALTAYAENHQIPLSKTEDGVPWFPIEDFVTASQELFGASHAYAFERIAAEHADSVPEGTLCVASGYGMALSLDLIDRGTVSSGQDGYSVWVNHYFFHPGDYTATLLREKLVFRLNPKYTFSPIQMLSLTEEQGGFAPRQPSPVNTAGSDGPEPLIDEQTWNEIEAFLNRSTPLSLLGPGALEEIDAGGTPADAYAAAAQAILVYAEDHQLPAFRMEDGACYFPIEDFVTASKELFGASYCCDFERLAAENTDPIPEGMLCAGTGYGLEMHLYLIDRDTVASEQGGYSVWLDDYSFYPAGGYDKDVVELTRRKLVFQLNPEYTFSPIRLTALTLEK